MPDLNDREINYLRNLDRLQPATDAMAGLIAICPAHDEAASGVVLRLAQLGYAQTISHGFICVRTGQPGETIYQWE